MKINTASQVLRTIIFFLLISVTNVISSFGVTVQQAATGTICVSSTATDIPNLIIKENAVGDFGANTTEFIMIGAPAGFVFDNSTNVTYQTGRDITGVTFSITSSSLLIFYTMDPTATKIDSLIIDVRMKAALQCPSGSFTRITGSNSTNSISGLGTLSTPTVTSGLPSTICANAGNLTLTATPSGGTFSGPSVSGGAFNPKTAGSGLKAITYTVTVGGCSNQILRDSISVLDSTAVTIGGVSGQICRNDQGYQVVGSPAGGTLSTFPVGSPAILLTNAGKKYIVPKNIPVANTTLKISYNYTGTNGCISKKDSVIVVKDSTTISFTPASGASFNLYDAPQTLTPTLGGGYFSGAGTSGNTFYPNLAGINTSPGHKVTYNATNSFGCKSVVTNNISVDNPFAPSYFNSSLATTFCQGGVSDPFYVTGVPPETATLQYVGFFCENQSLISFDPAFPGDTTHAIFNPAVAGTYNISFRIQERQPNYVYEPQTVDPKFGTVTGCGCYVFVGYSAWVQRDFDTYTAVTVNPATPPSFNVPTDFYTKCSNTPNFDLNPNPTGGTWRIEQNNLTYGSGTDLSPSLISGNNFVFGNVPTSDYYDIYYSAAVSGCPSVAHQYVYVYKDPLPTISGLASEYCISDGQVALTVSPPGGQLIGVGASTVGSSFYFKPSDAGVIVNTPIVYRLTQGTCIFNSPASNVSVRQAATVNAGTDQTVCGRDPVNLTTIGASIGGSATSATWTSYYTGGGVFKVGGSINNVFNVADSYTPSATDSLRNLSYGGYQYLVLTTNDPTGPCAAVIDYVFITNNKPAYIDAGSATTFCSDNTVILNGNISGNATSGTWYKGSIGGSQVGIGNANLLLTTYSLTPSEKNGGAITFYIQSNDPDGPTGPCGQANDNVTITINPEAVVDPGLTIYTCGPASVPLSGTCTKFGGGPSANLAATWSKGIWNSGLIAAGTNPKVASYLPTVAESAGGTYTYTLTSADPDGPGGPCPIVSKTVDHVIKQAPVVDAGVDTTWCSSNLIVLKGTTSGSTTSTTWYKGSLGTPDPGIANAAILSTTYTPTLAEKNGGTVTFYIESTDPDGTGPTGPCVKANDVVVITINPEAVVDAGTTVYTCGSAGVPLNGTCTKFGGGPSGNLAATWSKGAWNSLIAAGTNPKVATYIPSLAEANGGTYTYTLTSADPDGTGPCPIVSKTVDHIIKQAAFVDAGPDSVWCSNTTPVLTASLAGGSANNITWTKNVGAGSIQSPNNSVTNYLVNASDYASGTPFPINFTATTDDPDGTGPTGPCLAATDVVKITLNPHLTVNAGTDIVVCANQVINLNGNVKIGGIDRTTGVTNTWSVITGLGTPLPNGTDNFTGTYSPSGIITSSGIVIPGTGELGLGNTIILQLTSSDPDGTGPCTAYSDQVNIKLNPLPIPAFIGLAPEYCYNGAPVTLFGNVGSNPPSAVFTGKVPSSITVSSGNYIFSPAVTGNPGGSYDTLRYTFTDINICTNYVNAPIKIYPAPSVKFTMSSRCQNDNIQFTDISTLNTSTYPGGTKVAFNYLFEGASTSGLQNPIYSFSNFGNQNVKFKVTTNSGGILNCSNTLDSSFVIGPYPKAGFSWINACSVDSVVYSNTSTIPSPGTGAGQYNYSLTWNMNGAGAYKNSTNSFSAINSGPNTGPQYKYAAPGLYPVKLVAITNTYGCKDSLTKEVYILPTISVTASSAYTNDFSSSNQNWAPDGNNYSWKWGVPTLKTNMSISKNVWATNNATGTYNVNEQSGLNSPCFNFSALDKPMMTLKMWSANTTLSGAVLQASSDNGVTWNTVGSSGQGLNWYNQSPVIGLIGQDILNNPSSAGFSGIDSDWKISRTGLTQYANTSNIVRFRLLFGSPNLNVQLKDGIALDSVWIGNRTKTVLLEHFTNSFSTPSAQGNDTVNSIQNQRTKDMVSIHYHTSFPGVDNMNLKNTADPSARVLYYGVSSAPYSFVDGTSSYDTYNGTGAFTVNDIDSKALDNAKFELDISTVNTSSSVLAKVRVKAREKFSSNVVVQLLILENSIPQSIVGGNQSAYKWVVKKMLPDAGGTYISQTWAKDDEVYVVQEWDYASGDVYDQSQLSVVAFVQNITTKEVYQASYISGSGSSNPSSPVVTGITESEMSSSDIMVFPNPASNEAYVLFGRGMSESCDYVIYDQVGKIVSSGRVNKGVEGFSLNTSSYSEGAYQISLIKENGSKLHKQLLVVH